MTHDELQALLASWTLSLKSANKSPRTVEVYETGVRRFGAWCLMEGIDPDLSRENVRGFTDHLLNKLNFEPSTALTRQAPLRLFSAWLADEGEISRDELLGMKRVKLDEKIVPSLDEAQVSRLLKACGDGKSKAFVDIRDYAIVLFMLDTTCRANETISIRYPDDINVSEGTAVVLRGKGGKGRVTGFTIKTASAIDKYLRQRRKHPRAALDDLWLGGGGKRFHYSGLYRTLKLRGDAAGLIDFHPHILRHTGISMFLDAGGSEGSAMAKAGHKSRAMMDRYAKSTSERRAIDETRRINILGRVA
jgi:integrase/recombinase XerD